MKISSAALRVIGAAAIACTEVELKVLPCGDHYIAREGQVLSSAETRWGAECYLGWLIWSCDKALIREPELEQERSALVAAPWAGLPLMQMMGERG